MALLFASNLAFGQGIVTGSISGTVEDEQGALVSGAQVQATQIATNRTFNTASSNGGVLLVASLPPGTYKVEIQAPGFAAYTAGSVQVLVGKDTSLGRVRLKVGPATETLTVEGTAPLVENTTDQISATFENRQVTDTPIGSTYDSLALFVPGIAFAGSTGFSNNNGAELSINGQGLAPIISNSMARIIMTTPLVVRISFSATRTLLLNCRSSPISAPNTAATWAVL